MFDPFFLLLLLAAPIPLMMLIVYELQRSDNSILPRGPSVGLAIVSAGGLWVLLVFVRFKDGISETAFDELGRHTLLLASACVIGGYCLLAIYRTRRRKGR